MEIKPAKIFEEINLPIPQRMNDNWKGLPSLTKPAINSRQVQIREKTNKQQEQTNLKF